MMINNAKKALEAFGPDGTHPIPGVRLVKHSFCSWSVQALNEDLTWESMAHFTSAGEVVEWARRFA